MLKQNIHKRKKGKEILQKDIHTRKKAKTILKKHTHKGKSKRHNEEIDS
jgi:hypothetical protein